ncbi:hypothetical protein [Luteolibacter luteus]|uniref:Uncharacterized protein n=1 Tax=Luteolibacter luteus TaxID=2728835 RepID=A0A858RMZ1_9BACT|nr:hypothetical protein [Luteolibacter luteus]QJE97951.1 hypothetical protein HHL09_19890 [Luteolibacter luteus]
MGGDAEALFQGGTDLLRIEEGAPSDLVHRDESLRLPAPETAKPRPGRLTREEDLDALPGADKLRLLM